MNKGVKMKSISLFFLLMASSFSNAMTCIDANQRSMTYNQSDSATFSFTNLDTARIPGGVPYSTPDTGFISVPGAAPYFEYIIHSSALTPGAQLSWAIPISGCLGQRSLQHRSAEPIS
jgi:hypothetical protein